MEYLPCTFRRTQPGGSDRSKLILRLSSDHNNLKICDLRTKMAFVTQRAVRAMDGFKTTAEVRRREGMSNHTWIFAMTAKAMNGDREWCLASAVDDYLSEPTRTNELGAVLERVLSRLSGSVRPSSRFS